MSLFQYIVIFWFIGAIFWTGYACSYFWGIWWDDYIGSTLDKILTAWFLSAIFFLVWPLAIILIKFKSKPAYDAFDVELYLDSFGEIDWPESHNRTDFFEKVP